MPFWKNLEELTLENNALFFEGCSLTELAKRFGTPLYVYSENRIRSNYRRLFQAYSKYYPHFGIYYAIKANNHPAIVKILASEGCGADCSGIEEIHIAEQVGIPSKEILYSGVYNSKDELQYSLDHHVRLNIEDMCQLERIASMKIPDFLSFRVNPGIGSSGKEGLIFAGPNAKFGIPEKDIFLAYKKAKALGVKHFGIHMMTGSNILDPTYFVEVVTKLLQLAGPISKELGISFEFIDIGGSLGIPYHPEEDPLAIDEVAKSVTATFKTHLSRYEMGTPKLIHEPGRFLVGDAGILLTQVTAIKRAENIFIGCDAGMHTLLRPALYNAYHPIFCTENPLDPNTQPVTIVGPVCENTDQFAKGRALPRRIQAGEYLSFLNTGAYGFCMSSHYNTRPKVAEVLVTNGSATLIRERETFKDLVKGVHLPTHLQSY